MLKGFAGKEFASIQSSFGLLRYLAASITALNSRVLRFEARWEASGVRDHFSLNKRLHNHPGCMIFV